MRAKLQIPVKFEPWTSFEGRQMKGIPASAERERELVNLAYVMHCFATGNQECTLRDPDLFLDVSQSAQRMRARAETIPTLMRSSRMYSYRLDRVLVAGDLLKMIGHKANALATFSASESRSLIGETIPVQLLGIVMSALLRSVSW